MCLFYDTAGTASGNIKDCSETTAIFTCMWVAEAMLHSLTHCDVPKASSTKRNSSETKACNYYLLLHMRLRMVWDGTETVEADRS